jgi:hypothetical protein
MEAEGAEAGRAAARTGHGAGMRAIALVALLATAMAASGGLGAGAPPGPAGATADTEALVSMLSAAVTDPGRLGDIAPMVTDLAGSAAAEHLDLPATFALAFPRPSSVLSMLALDRDVDDFQDLGAGSGAAAAHYRRAAELAAALRPLRDNYGELFAAAWRQLRAGTAGLARSAGAAERAEEAFGRRRQAISADLLAERGKIEPPPLRDLAYSHPYALDVFYTKVDRRGDAEFGPTISALEGGIVVACASDWKGGAGASTWEGGGLSPSAGNGVVIYSPASRRYYSYFHFSDVSVRRGQAVEAGQAIGHGGNTGANARRRGHGSHLHLEIFDAAGGRSLSAREIRSVLFD